MKTINIKFVGRFAARDKQDFMEILKKRYVVNETDKPDYIFYGDSDYSYLKYDCVRIFYTGECITPNFNECDYAIAFDHIMYGDRYARIPLYDLFQYKSNYEKLKCRKAFTLEDLHKKTGFCNFVVSNCFAFDKRSLFYDALSKYKKVDSGGRYRNNVGGPVKDKLEFQRNYKFSIAFENCSHSGYTTEKIMEAFVAGTIPIYYGDPDVAKDFNSKAFINVHDYASFEDAIERVKEIDNNDELFIEMMNENPINPDVRIDDFEAFLYNIFDQPLDKVARRPHSMYTKKYEDALKRHIFFEEVVYRNYAKIKRTLYRIFTRNY